VLSSIHLHDQPGLEADEVQDIAAERYLALEFQARELPVSQRLPQQVFRLRRIGAHGSRELTVWRRRETVDQNSPSLAISRT
jgi:hypothetical protein